MGICRLSLPTGSPVVLEGPFSYEVESRTSSIRGLCPASAQCEIELFTDVRLVAELYDDNDSSEGESRPGFGDQYRPAGLLPGQPGLIIDIFPRPIGSVDAASVANTLAPKGGAM